MPHTPPPTPHTPQGPTPPSKAKSHPIANTITALYRLSKQTNGMLTMGLIITICLTVVAYSQVVERKTHLQTVIEQTQRMNEENNSLHVQLNQAQAYQGVIARQRQHNKALAAPTRTLAINSMSRPLTPPNGHEASTLIGALPQPAPITQGY